MEKNLYTFILEYLGGTYISQVYAFDIDAAMRLWLNSIEPESIEGFSNKDKEKLIQDNFSDEDPTLILGLVNVWHFLIDTERGTGFVNFVKTVSNN